MKITYNSRLLRLAGLILGVLVWLANVSNPPTGKTGAPFPTEGHCAECHSGGNPGGFNGDVTVTGLPSTIESNTTYPLTITLTPTAGSPVRGGFQLVAVDGNNANAGDLTAGNAQSGTEFFLSREYLEHRGGKIFTGGGPASWTFNWKSPVTAAGDIIKFYFVGNFTNGNNNDSGDFPIEFMDTYAFNGPPPLAASVSNVTNVTCFGGNNGSITVDPSGGLPPYTYHWSNNQTGQTAVNLTANTYSVTITGSGGTGTVTASATVTQPPQLTLSASVSGVLNCINTSVTATATPGGGAGGYVIEWSTSAGGNQTQLTAPGSYTVTVTDANGCTKVASVNVTGNTTPPNVEAGPAAALSCVQPTTTLNGAGSSVGAIFSYLWTTTGGGTITNPTTLTPTVNAPGTYTLVVTNNNNGCTASDVTTVTSNIQPPTATATGGTLTCTTTSVNLGVTTNATSPAYSWVGPNGFSSNQQNPATVSPGVYTVTVTNTTTGCTNTASATVTQNTTMPTVTASASGVLTCAVTSVALSGTTNASGATYAWSGPNFTSSQQNPSVNAPGVYTLQVTNPANGCTAVDTAAVSQNITAPTASTAPSGQLNCVNSTVFLNTTTNATSALYAWSGPGSFTSTQQNPSTGSPGTYTVTITNNANGCTATASAMVVQNTTPPVAVATVPGNLNCQTTSMQLNGTASSQGANFTYNWTTANGNITAGATTLTPTVNAAGTYVLLVTNSANGCTATASATVSQTPPVSAAVSNVTNVSCNGGSNGSATAMGLGGTGTFTYVWSSGATTATAGNLPSGTYIVTATDSENCTATTSATVSQPTILTVNATATGETALGSNDGTATAAPTGGTPNYTYLWSNSGTTATITNLAPGNYTVTTTDANGCTAVQTVTVNNFNCALSATIAGTNVTCFNANNGTATVSLTGAALPATYLWSNGDTTATASNLAPGMYTVQVTDANNCPAALSISITGPPALLPNTTSTNQTAVGLNNGTATAQPTGGTSPYTYLWSNSGTTATITGLAPGSYTVTVMDNNNCTAVQTVTVNAFNCTMTANISATNVSCAGGNDGQATAIPAGGTLPIMYSWSNSATTPTAPNLTAGTYTVVVTDATGCLTSSMVTITEPLPLAASVGNIMPASCPESTNGSATVTATGGTMPYTYTWPNNSGGQNLGVGTYTVSVVDGNGCSTTQMLSIQSNDTEPPGIICPTMPAVLCTGTAVQYPLPTVSDNCSLNGAQPILLSGLASGTTFPVGSTVQVYQVTDVSGNKSTCSFTITVEPPLVATLDGFTNDVGDAGVGTINVSVSGGNGAFMYAWQKDGQAFATTEDLSGLKAGVYTLVITDASGCTVALPAVTITNTVGTNTVEEQQILRVIPNPAKDQLRLEMIGIEPVAVQIVDIHGRMLRMMKSGEWTDAIDVSMLPAGLYYLRVQATDGPSRMIKWLKVQ